MGDVTDEGFGGRLFREGLGEAGYGLIALSARAMKQCLRQLL